MAHDPYTRSQQVVYATCASTALHTPSASYNSFTPVHELGVDTEWILQQQGANASTLEEREGQQTTSSPEIL